MAKNLKKFLQYFFNILNFQKTKYKHRTLYSEKTTRSTQETIILYGIPVHKSFLKPFTNQRVNKALRLKVNIVLRIVFTNIDYLIYI